MEDCFNLNPNCRGCHGKKDYRKQQADAAVLNLFIQNTEIFRPNDPPHTEGNQLLIEATNYAIRQKTQLLYDSSILLVR